MAREARLPLRSRLILAALGALIVVGLVLSPAGQGLDRVAYDAAFLVRGEEPSPSNVAVVAIDEDSFAELGHQWPWPRSLHAALVKSLFAAGAKAVVLDIVFAEPAAAPAEDQALAEALGAGLTVLAAERSVLRDRRFAREMLIEPIPLLASAAAAVGYVDYPVESDAFVRRSLARDVDEPPSLAEAAYGLMAGVSVEGIARPSRLIGFYGPPRTIETVSYYQALDPERYLPADKLRDKLVFIGFSTATAPVDAGAKDSFPTPYSRWGAPQMAGVEIHATVAANLLEGRFLSALPLEYSLCLAVVTAFLSALIFLRFSPVSGAAIALCCALVALVVTGALFTYQDLYLPPSATALPVVCAYLMSPFAHYAYARRQRNVLRRAFASYVAPALVDEIIADPRALGLGGKRVAASVMFIDLAGFTAISERSEPEELVELLNATLGTFADVIVRANGMIDKYVGDSLMAVWGAPLPCKDHALRSCAAACEILALIDREQLPYEVSVRIGLNSGRMVAGNIGGASRFNYTVLGNDVNTAARLESANKLFRTRALIGERCAREVGEHFLLRRVDRVLLKGQQTPLKIFELLAPLSEATPEQRRLVQSYAAALSLYEERRWREAANAFAELTLQFPDDGPAQVLLNRCRAYLEDPPPAEWDSTYPMPDK